MDHEEVNESPEATSAKTSSNLKLISLLAVIILLAAAGFVFYKKSNNTSNAVSQFNKVNTQVQQTPESNTNTPALTEEQSKQLAAGPDTSSAEKTFDINGGEFYFIPNKITVNKGDKVTFKVKNVGGFHDLVIDELNVKTKMLKSGDSDTATFKALQTGSFVYYCSVGNHRQKGMWGTLEVK